MFCKVWKPLKFVDSCWLAFDVRIDEYLNCKGLTDKVKRLLGGFTNPQKYSSAYGNTNVEVTRVIAIKIPTWLLNHTFCRFFKITY